MLANVGHTIQKMINNTPIAITANDLTTGVATNGGAIYQTGFIGGKIQQCFKEIVANENIVGKASEIVTTDSELYILNIAGSVFAYDYNISSCSPIVREIYNPAACNGDRAIHLVGGKSHVIFLTAENRIWGAGNNEQYQLVPQGQCRYDTAVELIVTDTNVHDNVCCNTFSGIYNYLEAPIIPSEQKCNKVSCIKNNLCDVLLGYLNIDQVTVCPPGTPGVMSIPVYGNLNYVGFLCADGDCASGSINYSITKLYIKCGCVLSKFTTTECNKCYIRELNTSSTSEIIFFRSDPCQSNNTDTCCDQLPPPISGVAQVTGKCGQCTVVNVQLPHCLPIPGAVYINNTLCIGFQDNNTKTTVTILCDGEFTEGKNLISRLALDFDVSLKCCESNEVKSQVQLPQPCWTNIFAGSNTSVLVDNCNRIYTFGSLHNVRNNRGLLKRSCLEELLNKTNASISFPADQLNCSNYEIKNDNCTCVKCRSNKFKTDLGKFGIHLNFPNNDDCNNMSICDFLKSLKKCNDKEECNPTCEPCDGYIYLNISKNDECPCDAPAAIIGSITLLNRRSVCKYVSQGYPDLITVSVDMNSDIEYNLNRYCIDSTDISLDKIVKLEFCSSGPNVNLYLDIDQNGGIRFISDDNKYNIEFSINASNKNHQFLLNYGTVLDPVELTNLKYALSIDCFYPCPRFKNPFDTKITSTYLRGGDRIKFITTNPKNLRLAITPDVPTVFRLNRRVLDIGVGNNNLSVLVGGLACPNEIYAIGNNCYGELGIGSNESTVCWKQLNRCKFDCQVNKIFAGKNVTFYITQSNQTYATGKWKSLVDSIIPCHVKSICQSWKIMQMAISDNQIILLGSDGCIFGLGDNNLGELGLCHLKCVLKPTPLVFFYKLNNNVAKQLQNGLMHPVESNYGNCCNKNRCDQYDCDDKRCDYENDMHNRCNSCGVSPCECNRECNRKCGPCGPCGPSYRGKKKYMPNNRIYARPNRY